ncbi:phosphate ABC transporter permease subunit PstC [Pseudenhygromyxa sp. WMMC2535]|uniref:phosphate ABC transporter permease subunit PstC n=1 Tax=Pseudenhygromyxa sp. WMMC2535 TaxID=2712867 RepID=UPI001554CCB9|nr:phosphate ABC transporter permease subunit PstC [Pseudenhygromyxa sp. WMMC2535]NVB42330.1 phosphate ABC transporter permease subunit PstC [Pseudenhygromyxa sp. WMMC2535]
MPQASLQPKRSGAGPRPSLREQVGARVPLACALTSVVAVAALGWALVDGSVDFFTEVSPGSLLAGEWDPAQGRFGLWPLLAGTALIAGIALTVALPLGVLAALYLAEFAPPSHRHLLEPLFELLAGVPTVVYGYLALVALTPLLQQIIPGLASFNALSPGVIVGVMLVPTVASLSTKALRAVPWELREAAWALGAGELRTISRVVLPGASAGIAAAIALAIARAVGETMIVALAAGRSAWASLDPRVPAETMSAAIVWGRGEALAGVPGHGAIFVLGALLLAFTFAFNTAASRMMRRLEAGEGA